MYIDIDATRVYLKVDEVVGLATWRDEVLKDVHDRTVEVGVLHIASIDKEELLGASALSIAWQGDEA